MSTTNQNIQNECHPLCHDDNFPANDDKASEKLAAFADKGLAENMSKPPQQIYDLRRESVIAEEHAKDVESKFWATYKKVSNEYDDDFLERANDDMAIILTFAGLFSAVNSTFIVGMQPNPGDTTNMLMLELVKIIADPNAVHDISSLSSSTGYSSSNVWMQTLAYGSLSFSVLAAFGAVMGKQWLNSYKAARGQGSLEERSLRRQRKLDELEKWRLQTVLGAFLVLLQISLLLFGLSLSANMFTQRRTISSIIICTTALGVLFYMATILISSLHPDSPFQTAGSALIGAIYNKFSEFIEYRCMSNHFLRRFLSGFFLRVTSRSIHNEFDKSSAIRWILETSTDPEVVGAAAAMVPLKQWPSKFDASAIYTRLRVTFWAYHGRQELCVKYLKAMAHLCSQSVTISTHFLLLGGDMWECGGGKGRFIRDAFVAGRLAWDQSKGKDEWKHKANARIALRTIIVHGMRSRLSRPDDEEVIWDGDLRWRHSDGKIPSCEEFDWLIDYLAAGRTDDETDDKTEGDALLALSAMRGLGSPAKRPSYVNALIRCMHHTSLPRVRNAALRAVSDASEELASITCGSMPQGLDATLLDELSRALSTVMRPSHSSPETLLVDERDCCYLRLIFSLVQNEEWYNRLIRDDHIEWCISLYDEVLTSFLTLDKVYLSGILLRINPASKDTLNLAQEKWWMLIKRAWNTMNILRYYISNDAIEALPTLMAATRQHLPRPHNDVARAELAVLATNVHGPLENLKQREDSRRWEEGGIMTLIDAALPTLQGLYDDLSSYADTENTSQVDNGLVGS